ncbi:MAG TPA: response regulator [Rhodanobacteraceae bacterium]|nr:response regulator [Rhodanobacteraceae bacterium]
MNNDNLSSVRILIVEDESLVSMLLEDMLGDLGCIVAAAASELGDAKAKLSSTAYDAVILDVNLNGARTFGIAQTLAQSHTPFVFSTGYGADGIPAQFRGVPILSKPFSKREVERALAAALDAGSRSPQRAEPESES